MVDPHLPRPTNDQLPSGQRFCCHVLVAAPSWYDSPSVNWRLCLVCCFCLCRLSERWEVSFPKPRPSRDSYDCSQQASPAPGHQPIPHPHPSKAALLSWCAAFTRVARICATGEDLSLFFTFLFPPPNPDVLLPQCWHHAYC